MSESMTERVARAILQWTQDDIEDAREAARAAIAVAAEEFAKIAEAVRVHANGHPQIDAPNPGDMQRAIVAAIRGALT